MLSLLTLSATVGCGTSPSQEAAGPDPGTVSVADVYGEGEEGNGLFFQALADAIAGPDPTVAARDAFNRADPDRRRVGLIRISNSEQGGDPAFLEVYRLLLDDPDATVRAAAAAALARHGAAAAGDADRLVPLLAPDQPLYVRWEAAKALRHLPSPAARRALTLTLRNDPDAEVRLAAAQALGRYQDPEAFDALVIALNDLDFGVVESARRSLVLLTGRDAGLEPGSWRDLALELQAGSGLFDDAQPYTFRDYPDPPTLLQRLNPFDDR